MRLSHLHIAAIAFCLACSCTVTAKDFVGGNLVLKALLDEPEAYCLDVFGFGMRANIDEPLSVHTCKPEGWRDATFTVDYPDAGQIYMPAYDLCAEVSQFERGAHLFLKACSESPLQRFIYREDQKIEVQGSPGPSYCLTVHPADGIATGGPSHVRREVLILICEEVEAEFAQWLLPEGPDGLDGGADTNIARGARRDGESPPAGGRPLNNPEGVAAFYDNVCGPCHGSEGQGRVELFAPKLSGQESWYLHRQMKNFVEGRRGAHEDERWASQMKYQVAPFDDDRLIEAVVAHITTLEDEPAVVTVEGDVVRGESLYLENCALCHGVDGMGIEALNAPRQAGMTDWYILRQMEKFRQGVRGDHPDDTYGAQMAPSARALPDEQALLDIVAYINTLPRAQ